MVQLLGGVLQMCVPAAWTECLVQCRARQRICQGRAYSGAGHHSRVAPLFQCAGGGASDCGSGPGAQASRSPGASPIWARSLK